MRHEKPSSVWNLRRVYTLACRIGAVFRRDMIAVYAAQASFFLLLSSAPFLVLLLNIGKLIFRQSPDTVLTLIEGILPETLLQGLPLLGEQIKNGGGIPLLSLSAATALWSASRGIAALERGLAGVYGVDVSRGLLRDSIRSLMYTIVFLLLLLLTLILLVFGAQIADGIMSVFPSLERPITAVLEARGIFVFLGLSVFFTLEHRAVIKHAPVLPGAALSGAGWMLFSYLYSLYAEIFPRASYLYGSLALLTALMLWVYFCMIIFLCGAQVNKMLDKTRVPPP